MSMPATSTKTTKLATSLIDEYALLGWRAMLTEVNLSPKPGLVDRINCGAHKDMALEDFHRSALATMARMPIEIQNNMPAWCQLCLIANAINAP